MNQATQKPSLGKTVVLMGGIGAERQVSLASGRAMAQALTRLGHDAETLDISSDYLSQLMNLKADRVVIALHGMLGESGDIQNLLEAMSIPYTGSSAAACALSLDKITSKYVLKGAGIPTAPFIALKKGDPIAAERYVESLGLPLFVKPAHEGSSVGIQKVLQEDELLQAIESAFEYDDSILIEAFLSGDEYSVPWLNGTALPAIRIQAQSEFYDYDAKYLTGTTQYHIPSGLSTDEEQWIANTTEQVARLMGLDTWGRIDFMKDGSGKLQVIEINSVPGMTETSLVPKAANEVGVSFDQLVEGIAEKASLKNRC